MTDIEYKETRIRELRDEITEERKREQREKNGKVLKDLYDSLLAAGFDEKQAWYLFVLLIKSVWEQS